MRPTIKQPLFIVSGASGVGKSTASELLFQKEKDYVVLESDLLWNSIYNTPDDNYREYRRVWTRVAANVAQIGKPVVLCGSADPEQFEHLPERELFTDIHYLAVVCDNEVLESRMRKGRKITDENWIRSSVTFNNWLKENADKTTPQITLLDNSALSPLETAEQIERWIRERL
ncbi:MAG: AAA family ATPase [Clostridia bacterium]|nr:AAA family ATPase [Clostridia bacterium]